MDITKLSQPFSEELFLEITEGLLGNDLINDSRSVRSNRSFKYVKEIKNLGHYSAFNLQVFIVKHTSENDSRVGLTKELFSILKEYAFSNALVATYSGSKNWRYSLLTSTLEISGGGKVARKFSSPKRHSYMLGEYAKVATPYKYLVKSGEVSSLEELKKRFSAEVVNNDFYREIARLYDHLVGAADIPAKIKYPASDEECHQFAVRFIGRIVFCWFLREKKSTKGIPLIPESILSRNASSQSSYYHTVLAPLFFEVLNKDFASRGEKYQTGENATIPYLNGGLFNPDYNDYYRYDKNLEVSVPGTVDVPDEWISELFDLLELYNFTVDENTTYDIDLSIDPEMLGRIFENLLARINPETGETVRKLTGSFYTPREIVEYMADQSLKSYLIDKTGIDDAKISALISFDLMDDVDNPLTSKERQAIANALGRIKVLDPACGSGAFPIGVLQKIVFILQQADPNAELWLAEQLKGASPELRQHFQREFRNQNFDYVRKLGIIRECIFGIDIQPIATEISRLRCFLTLIVDQAVDDDTYNRGIEPLPNLDFKFVTANTLTELGKVIDTSGQAGLFEDSSGISELKNIRDDYFSSHNLEKEVLKSKFIQTQNRMLQKMIANHTHGFADVTQRLSSWDPFSHKTTSWFDAAWMFGIESGFDVVIANPPYVDSEHMVNQDPENREMIKEVYSTTVGNWDLFIPFIEKGMRETKEHGVLTYIIPNKLVSAKYAASLRSFLSEYDILEVRDYSRLNVFSEADVYPITISVRNSRKLANKADFVVMKDLFNVERSVSVISSEIGADTYWDKYFLETPDFKLIHKLSKLKKLKDGGFIVTGAATVSEAYIVKDYLKDSSITENAFKLVNTGTIDKYRSLWGKQKTQYIKAAYQHPIILKADLENMNKTRLEQARSCKLIIAGMSNQIEAFMDSKGEYLAGKSTSIIVGDTRDIAYCLAILNSKLATYYISNLYRSLKMAGGYLNINKNIIESVPLPDGKNKELVEDITAISMKSELSEADISRLDDLVYKLYELTDDDIKLINVFA